MAFRDGNEPAGETPKVPKLNSFQRMALAFSLAKYAGTFPMPRDDADDNANDAFSLRIGAYLVSAAYPILGQFIPERESRGGLLILTDLFALGSSLGADGLDEADVWTWAIDSTSNGGGILQGIGQLIPNAAASALFAGGGVVVSLGAAIAGLARASKGLLDAGRHKHSDKSESLKPIYLVNIGG